MRRPRLLPGSKVESDVHVTAVVNVDVTASGKAFSLEPVPSSHDAVVSGLTLRWAKRRPYSLLYTFNLTHLCVLFTSSVVSREAPGETERSAGLPADRWDYLRVREREEKSGLTYY